MSRVIPAVVEPAQVDIDALAEHCIVGYADLQGIEKQIVRARGKLEEVIAAAKVRRLQLGQWLSQARATWPERGPNAKGWGEFCARVKIPDSTARAYIAEYRHPAGFAERKSGSAKPDDQPDDDQTGPRVTPAPRESVLFTELTREQVADAIKRLKPEDRTWALRQGKANLIGGSGEVERGTWCTPKHIAIAIGPVDHDPFSNPRAHILAATHCMLEDGGDGFGDGQPGEHPGHYLLGSAHGSRSGVAGADDRVFLQPRYDDVLNAIAHYEHTRMIALLRFAPDVAWFRRLWLSIEVCAIFRDRVDFEPPPGIAKPESSSPYPHALYYRDHRDVTDAVRELCLIWHVDHTSSALPSAAQLHLVS